MIFAANEQPRHPKLTIEFISQLRPATLQQPRYGVRR
jgi:hypothetical protein